VPMAADSVVPTLDIRPFIAALDDPYASPAAVAVAKQLGAAFEATGFAIVVGTSGTGLPPRLGHELYQLSARCGFLHVCVTRRFVRFS